MKTISIFTFGMFLFVACSNEQNHEEHGDQNEAGQTEQRSDTIGEHNPGADDNGVKYTCPMHPNVVQDQPGKCPVCGMDLVKVTKTDGASDDLMLTDSQIKLANITTAPVNKKPIGQTVVINGQLKVDEQKSEVISSRAAGRLEKLFIKETGQRVKQ